MQLTAFASVQAEVYADEVTAVADETVLIPVRIKNNSGIMGFKITVTYDTAVLQSPTVNRGSITRNGNFNDSIGVTPDGVFDVVWSDTQNATGDGTLMIIGFRAISETKTTIGLSFSQPDTFNEAWEDVVLNCSEITVDFVDKSEAPITSSVQSSSIGKEPDTEEVKSAVDIVLDETGKGNLEEINEDEKENFINRVNNVLGHLVDAENKYFTDFEDLKETYSEAASQEFVDNVKESADGDKIDAAISASLDSMGAETIDDLSAEKKDEFVKAVEKNLGQNISDFDTISDKLTADDAVEAIKQLQNENAAEATQGEKIPVTYGNEKNTGSALIIAVVIVLAAITTIIVVYIYKKKKLKEAKTNEESM